MYQKQNALVAVYSALSSPYQNLLQLMAVLFLPIARTNLVSLANRAGIRAADGTPLNFKAIRDDLNELIDSQVIHYESRAQTGPIVVNSEILDYVFRDAMRCGSLPFFQKVIDDSLPHVDYSYRHLSKAIQMRKAFYSGDMENWKKSERLTGEYPVLMNPFQSDSFHGLTADFKCISGTWFIQDAIVEAKSIGANDFDAVVAFLVSVAASANTTNTANTTNSAVEMLLDLHIAQGDLDGLERLHEKTEGKRAEIRASLLFLKGDFDDSLTLFETAIKEIQKRKKTRTAVFTHLPSMLYVFLLLRQNTSKAQKKVAAILKKCWEWENGYQAFVPAMFQAREFQTTLGPDEPQQPCPARMSPFCFASAGWAWRWFYSGDRAPLDPVATIKASEQYHQAGLSWLAAELDSFLAEMPDSSVASAHAKRCAETHSRLGTVSLSDFIQPVPPWEKSLHAIEQFLEAVNRSEQASVGKSNGESQVHEERMIWEVRFAPGGDWIQVDPYLQKLSKRGWTKGRKVALARIYENPSSQEFEFLSTQDQAICQSLRQSFEISSYGYRETNYQWNTNGLVQALVGHPLLFRPDDRTTPIEIALAAPGLTIQQTGQKMKFAVSPPNDGGSLVIQDEGANRVSIVEFNKRQQQLAEIISTMPAIPTSQEDRIAAIAQSLSPVIAVQSDIDGATPAGKTIEADSKILVQLTPYQQGLRAELFVRPLGEEGPFCRPGQGAASVFASVLGKPLTTRRDLKLEKKRLVKLLATSHQLDVRTVGDEQTEWLFHSTDDALELVVELQALAADSELTVLWPRGKTHDIAGQATSKQFRVSVSKDRDWFAASGKLKVNSQLTLDMMNLLDLVSESPSRFLKLDDGRFLALTAELRERIAEIASLGSVSQGKVRFAPIRALAMHELMEETNTRTDKHWKAHLARIEESATLDSQTPSTLQTELRDYQQEGFAWLTRLAHWNTGACLADDMGLGKTIQALALLIARASEGPALVVAPASVGFNWESESVKFAPTLTPKIFRDLDRDQFFAELAPGDVAITSYGLIQSEIKRFAKVEWNTILLDEAQAIKNMETKRSQAVMKLQGSFRVILTGTPLENHLGELWNLFRFITPGLLGSSAEFRERFSLPIERDQCRKAKKRLQRLIQPFLLRRTKTEVLSELPPRSESVLEIEMSPAEVALYEALRQKALEKMAAAANDKSKKGEKHLQILAELTRLRLACCHPSLVGGEGIASSKLEMFRHKIREIVDGRHKVLVFSQFVKHLSILRKELDAMEISYQTLDGSTPTKKRKSIVEAFQNGDGDVFLISLKAGGTGLNLTAADYVIHMDPWWNPAVEDQATDRAHRIGQSRPVNVYRFITKGTIEEKIVALHQTKRDLADSLLSGSHLASKLSTDDLIALLRDP